MKKPARKGAKRKAKAAPRKRASAKPVEKVTPNRLAKGASIRMSLHDVIKVVKMIEKNDHLNKFTSKLRREQALVSVPADTVNLVKDFVAENGMHKSSMGKHIVFGRRQVAATTNVNVIAKATTFAADDGDPGQCHFGRAERG
jgi:hypothetical protein